MFVRVCTCVTKQTRPLGLIPRPGWVGETKQGSTQTRGENRANPRRGSSKEAKYDIEHTYKLQAFPQTALRRRWNTTVSHNRIPLSLDCFTEYHKHNLNGRPMATGSSKTRTQTTYISTRSFAFFTLPETLDSHVLDIRLLVKHQGPRGSCLPGKPRLPVAGDAPDLLASDHHLRQQRVHNFSRLRAGNVGVGMRRTLTSERGNSDNK